MKDAFVCIAHQRFNPKENQASQGKKVDSVCPKTHCRGPFPSGGMKTSHDEIGLGRGNGGPSMIQGLFLVPCGFDLFL